MNKILESKCVSTYETYGNVGVSASGWNSENHFDKQNDDIAVVLELSEDISDGIVSIKSIEGVSPRISNQEYQSKLATLGFYSGSYDGNLSSDSCQKAIKNFQKVYGLSETGSMNTATSNKLIAVYNDYINLYLSDAMDTISSALYHDTVQRQTFAKVYTFLKNGMGLNNAQIAGVMGNMHAESGVLADNANDNYYAGEHNPEYANVYNSYDGIAFGLIQWAYSSRKIGLYDMATEMAASENSTDIANSLNNINTQLAYFRKEMNEDYSAVWQQITRTADYNYVSDLFLCNIENPNNALQYSAERRAFAKTIYDALVTL